MPGSLDHPQEVKTGKKLCERGPEPLSGTYAAFGNLDIV